MSGAGSAPCEWLPWDTEFFRCRIARVCGDTLRPEQAAQVDGWSRDHKIQCLYFLARVDDPATIRTAGQHGFSLVDVRVTFECVAPSAPTRDRPSLPAGVGIRAAQTTDLPGLQAIAREAHRDTRFFNDPHFPRERVEELYPAWITLEVEGRARRVWVAAAPRKLLGYVSCHLDPARQTGQIGLVGVCAEARGKGLGRNLVAAALGWFGEQNAKQVTVVTQGNNPAAQRLYQRCGFLSRDLQLWHHKWYPPSD